MTMTKNTTVPQYIPGKRSAWGKIQSVRKVADGIDWISTASHGGFRLSEDRYGQMPEWLRPCSFTNDQFFEEDCAWCAVVLAFPMFFDADEYHTAQRAYATYYGKAARLKTA